MVPEGRGVVPEGHGVVPEGRGDGDAAGGAYLEAGGGGVEVAGGGEDGDVAEDGDAAGRRLLGREGVRGTGWPRGPPRVLGQLGQGPQGQHYS